MISDSISGRRRQAPDHALDGQIEIFGGDVAVELLCVWTAGAGNAST